MTKFEYLTVFESILLAFAVSEILSGLGRIVRERHRIRPSWVHVAWMLLVVAVSTQYWWNVWTYRSLAFTSYVQFAAIFLPTLTLILIAFLLTPTLPEGPVDLREYYLRNRTWIFPLAALMLVEIGFLRALLGLEPPLHPVNAVRALAAAVLVSLSFVTDLRIHGAAASLAWGLFLLSFLFPPSLR